MIIRPQIEAKSMPSESDFSIRAAIMRYALSFRIISKKAGSAHQFNLNRAAVVSANLGNPN